MRQEEWAQIEELFEQALDVLPGDRKAFLDRACNGKESLRRQVESLLANHEQAGNFLEEPPGEIAAELLTSEGSWFARGQSISHYTVVEFLGAGGMGEVYLARDPRLNRRVAIKALPRAFVSNDDRVRRFEQEARAASALNHPNIVTIHEVGKAGDAHFMVAEFIDGETLSERLARTGPMNIGEALDVALQVANALQAAHAAGIVHRDVKPDNIMIRPDGLVKVLDFGLAKLSEPETFAADEIPTASSNPGRNTNLGPLMGTVRYMSPEQARGHQIDARADVWSLGVVLFEMVAGVPPFDGATRSHVIAEVLDEAVPPLSAHVKNMPAELERIVGKSLTRNPGERYQTAKDLAIDLKNLRVQLEERGVAAPAGRSLKPRHRSKVGVIAASAAVVLVVGVLSYNPTPGRTLDSLLVSEKEVGTGVGSKPRSNASDTNSNEAQSRSSAGSPAFDAKRSEAQQHYDEGRFYHRKLTREGLLKGREYFEKAILGDPNYAPAYVGMANHYAAMALFGEMPGSQAWPKSEEFALKALARDRTLGEAHTALAAVRMWYERDWVNAEREFKMGIQLAPKDPEGYQLYSRLLGARGKFEDAIKVAKMSDQVEGDPNDPYRRQTGVAGIYFLWRRYDLAVEEHERIIRENLGGPQEHIGLAEAYVQQGQFEQARDVARRVRPSLENRPLIRLGVVFAASGDTREAKEILNEGKRLSLERHELNYFIAAIYVALKDNDNAILWLSKAVGAYSNAVIDLNYDPRFDGLRKDPRFEELLGRLNLFR